MIVGRIENCAFLDRLPEPIRRGLAIVRAGEYAAAAPGRHALPADGMYLQINEYDTVAADSTLPEAHREYCDIQYVHAGVENMGWAPLGGPDQVVGQPYDAERDVEFYRRCGDLSYLTVRAGMFAVFMPEDIHQPGLDAREGVSVRVRKHIVKVRAALLFSI